MKLLTQLTDERAEITETMNGICDTAADEHRDLTEAEQANLEGLGERAEELDARCEMLRDHQLRSAEAGKLRAEVTTPADDGTPDVEQVRVTSEPLTYSAQGSNSFLRDVYLAQHRQDPSAGARIARHSAEMEVEHRDVGTGAFAGLVVPQYLTDQAAALVRAGRVTANLCNSLPLPGDGMTVNISRVTTGSSTAVQATENSAVSETDIDDTLLTVDIRTIAGQQDVSRQAIERGTGVDALVMNDLAASYAATLDTQVINGSGSSGQHLGILNTSGIGSQTYTAATATIAGLWPKLIATIGDVSADRGLPPDALIFAPRRWSWIVAQLDGNNRPLVLPAASSPTNAMGVGDPGGVEAVGQIAGVPCYVDGNMPVNLGSGTDEDRIIAIRRADQLLWEQGNGSPALLRMEQTTGGSLTVKMVVYAYSGFTAGRYPTAVSVLGGTGLNDTL
jgi:HK97 family phage major capsid protein